VATIIGGRWGGRLARPASAQDGVVESAAQLAAVVRRAAFYGTEGQRFESSRARFVRGARQGNSVDPVMGSATVDPDPRGRLKPRLSQDAAAGC